VEDGVTNPIKQRKLSVLALVFLIATGFVCLAGSVGRLAAEVVAARSNLHGCTANTRPKSNGTNLINSEILTYQLPVFTTIKTNLTLIKTTTFRTDQYSKCAATTLLIEGGKQRIRSHKVLVDFKRIRHSGMLRLVVICSFDYGNGQRTLRISGLERTLLQLNATFRRVECVEIERSTFCGIDCVVRPPSI